MSTPRRIELPGGWYFEQSQIDEEPSWQLINPAGPYRPWRVWWVGEDDARAFAAAMSGGLVRMTRGPLAPAMNAPKRDDI